MISKNFSPILLFILSFAAPAFTQDFHARCGDVFQRSKYPADSFGIQKKEYTLGSTTIILTLLHPQFQGNSGNFLSWIEQRKGRQLLKSKYLGEAGSESGIKLPASQPFGDFFMLKNAGEFTGIFFLIHTSGNWYEVPGHFMQVNKSKTKLYTYVPAECGGCTIGTFDRRTRKIQRKEWDGDGVAWAEAADTADYSDPFKNGEWLQWQPKK